MTTADVAPHGQRRQLRGGVADSGLLDGTQVDRRQILGPQLRHRAGDDMQQVHPGGRIGGGETERRVERVGRRVAEVECGDDRLEASHGVDLPRSL
jgi:hypothetical protein